MKNCIMTFSADCIGLVTQRSMVIYCFLLILIELGQVKRTIIISEIQDKPGKDVFYYTNEMTKRM